MAAADGFAHKGYFVRITFDIKPTVAPTASPLKPTVPTAHAPVYNVVECLDDDTPGGSGGAPNTRVELLRKSDNVAFMAEAKFDETSGTLAALRDIAAATHADGSNFPPHLLIDFTPAADDQSVTATLKEVTVTKRVFSFEDGTLVANRVVVAAGGAGASGGGGAAGAVTAALDLRLTELDARVATLAAGFTTSQGEIATLKERVAAIAATGGAAGGAGGGASGCASCTCADTRKSVTELRESVDLLRTLLGDLTRRVDGLSAAPADSATIGGGKGTETGTGATGAKHPYTSHIYKAGDEVRLRPGVVAATHGWGSIARGYSKHGVVTSVAVSGVVHVRWPDQSDWMAAAEEIEPVRLDLQIGDSVKVRPSVTNPRFGKGSLILPYTSAGTVLTKPSHNGKCYKLEVRFPAQASWTADADELERAPAGSGPAPLPVVVDPASRGGFKVGDRVRLKAGLTTVKNGWGSVPRGYREVGTVRSFGYSATTVNIDFPAQKDWTADVSELEHATAAPVPAPVPASTEFVVGSKVRVRPAVVTPKYGWGSVAHGQEGTVVTIRNATDMTVDFASQKGWVAFKGDMELVGGAAASAAIGVGDRVRVKASVANPKYGWGSVSRGDIGVVASATGTEWRVNFPKQTGWSANPAELEKVD